MKGPGKKRGMMSCDHFTIRGAVAGFRKKDWRLNCPYKLKPKAVLPPLTVPSFRWWYCDSCVQYLIKGSSGVVEMVSNSRSGLNLNNFCSLQPVETGYRVVPSSVAPVITRGDSSYVNTCAAVVNDASAIQPCGRMSLENVRAATNATTDSQMESEDALTLVGHSTDFGLRLSERQRAMFDLNQIPESEISELAESVINDELVASVDEAELQIESAKFVEPVVSAFISDATQRFNHRPSPEIETSESPICEGAAVPDCNASGKRKIPKYRSLAYLLRVEGQKTEHVPSKGGMEVCSSSANDNKSKKKKLKNKEKSPRCSMSRDAPEGKVRNRTVDSSLLKDNGRLYCGMRVQPSLVPCGKRTARKRAVPDALSKPSIPTQSERHKPATLNEAVNMILPQKQRIFCNDFVGTNANIGKSGPAGSIASRKKPHSNYVARKIFNHVQLPNKASAREDSYQELFGAEHPIKHVSDVRPTVSEQRPADGTQSEVVMQLVLGDRSPSSSQLLSLHSEGSLSGMQMLNLVAAENAVPTHRAALSNFDGYTGCIEARVPMEFVSMEQAGELFKLGPEDLPLRSRRNKYMREWVQQETKERVQKNEDDKFPSIAELD